MNLPARWNWLWDEWGHLRVNEKMSLIFEFVILLATTSYAIVASLQWCAMNRSNEINHMAVVSIQRAFLFARRPHITPLMDHDSIKHFRIDIFWENSGSTPARGAIPLIPIQFLPDRRLPADYIFAQNYASLGAGRITIPPKGDAQTQLAEISSADLRDIISGKKFLYVWGSVQYRDVFPEDPIHVTEYCFEFGRLISRDVNTVSAPMDAEWPACATHNCSDDDCPDYEQQVDNYAKALVVTPTPVH
jgi:hypothetical protein